MASVTDDDWFERALREDERESDGADDESADSSSATDPETEQARQDPEVADLELAGTEPADSEGFADAPEFTAEADAEGVDSEGESGGFDSAEGPDGFDTANDSGEFGMDGTDAAPPSESGESPAGDSPTSDPADESSGDDSSADASQTGGFADADPYDADEDDEDLFDEDFASAFESAPGGGAGPASGDGPGGDSGGGFDAGGGEFGMGGDEGFGGFGGESFESEEFDDEEFESSIPRIDLGIEGLDDMIQGGVPRRSLVTTIGSAGTGKTTFGLQFLHEALEQGENAVFITLEESHDRIVNTATEKGWDFDEYEEKGQLAVIDLDPIEMANSLTSIRNDLPRLVEQFGATRLVLDSVSLLEMMYDDQSTRRNEVYDFTKSLKEAGVTTMLTSEASEDNAYASRHGIIEYLVDAVFILRYIRSTDDFRETRLAVEIQKIRDANHSREIKPYSITNEGISVYRQANIF
nr:KaiC domain-containing protein [Halorussus sp. DT72]